LPARFFPSDQPSHPVGLYPGFSCPFSFDGPTVNRNMGCFIKSNPPAALRRFILSPCRLFALLWYYIFATSEGRFFPSLDLFFFFQCFNRKVFLRLVSSSLAPRFGVGIILLCLPFPPFPLRLFCRVYPLFVPAELQPPTLPLQKAPPLHLTQVFFCCYKERLVEGTSCCRDARRIFFSSLFVFSLRFGLVNNQLA